MKTKTELIWNEYHKELKRFVLSKVKDRDISNDILQDVFYQFIGNTQPIEQLTGWLFTVARNKITDKKRKHKPELLEDIFSGDEENGFSWTDLFFNASNNPENEYLKNIFWETLNNALDELPEEQRTVFVQNELEGISFKDISAETGVAVNTLLSRKRYAVLHLRERLQILKFIK